MKAADIARAAFDKLLDIVAARTFDSLKHAGPEHLVQRAVDDLLAQLRHDIERVIIELRFEVMEVQSASLDLQKLVGEREAREAYERGKAIADGMDITVVDPDGMEHKP